MHRTPETSHRQPVIGGASDVVVYINLLKHRYVVGSHHITSVAQRDIANWHTTYSRL